MKTSDDQHYDNKPLEYSEWTLPVLELQEHIEYLEKNKPKKPNKYYYKKLEYYNNQLKAYGL